jgi:signal transduction histidine kinase
MVYQTSIMEIGILYTLHEMKNPLTAILLCLDLLESDDGTNTEFLHQTIKQKVMDLKSEINELSDYLIKSNNGHTG